MKKKNQTHPIWLLAPLLFAQIAAAVDFIFNGFDSSDVALYGNATVDSSRILTLTNRTSFSVGRALYPSKIPTKNPNSPAVLPFFVSFIFAMAPYRGVLPGHGIVFLFTPHAGIDGTSASQNLGLFNFTNNGDPNNHVFGVEFDVFKNEEFHDIDANHVGIDVDSLTSEFSHAAGYWPDGGHKDDVFDELTLNNGKNYQVWIDFAGGVVNVTMAPAGIKKPNRPLLSAAIANITGVFEDEMYVGFTSSTGALVQSHKILAWSFSNTNASLSNDLITVGLPSFELPKTPLHKTRGFIASVTAAAVLLIILCSALTFSLISRNQRLKREREEMEDWELEYWPHRIPYQEIESATRNFSDDHVIGVGGNGRVYKGTFRDGSEVAVKRISHESSEGIRTFLAEISSLGRLKQRNLVGLRGWCKKEKGSLILVYDYMENGSLDKRVFDCEKGRLLSYRDRIQILKQVASGLQYLHYGWESKVLHRDIKASNILLDKDMNARLGDFGLARMHDHDKAAGTTRVVGTVGYLAPEVVRNGKASMQTDVFGYGVLILEVICGRRPIEEGKPPLVEWVWERLRSGELIAAVDKRMEDVDDEEVLRVLHLGVLCAHPDANSRPTMRQVVKVFEGRAEGDETESEDTDVYLLEKMRNSEMWRMEAMVFTSGSSSSSHPTFEEIRQGLNASMSLSWSNTIVDGR
ncbi:L-type lectin-domain containing receptor kinase VII.1-like [Andrographis paniculata]|uniref:L-type lectin-domain containing receptor kinase VII.1-like n=1 Tax=Andrographis paniculata TaxID=175694 RepID=UPI0021E7589C|nr:L-type lectin-domain containing receptor kinase VII.1-like [Andrographis paniculata]